MGVTREMATIGVIAGKGGVGKTTISILLARIFHSLGLSVGLLDGDVYGPSIAHLFKEGSPPIENAEGIIPGDFLGIQNISLGYFQQEEGGGATVVRAPIANAVIQSFLQEVTWRTLDCLIVDFPPGTGDVPLTLMQTASFDGVVVVTTPEDESLWDVEKAIDMATRLNIPILGIVENKSFYSVQGEEVALYPGNAGRDLAEKYSVHSLIKMPFIPSLSKQVVKKHLEGDPLVYGEEIAIEISGQIWDNGSSKDALQLKSGNGNLLEIFRGTEVVQVAPYELQRRCPCSACQQKRNDLIALSTEGVVINAVRPVGQFGWKIEFSSGCSLGLYSRSLIELFRN